MSKALYSCGFAHYFHIGKKAENAFSPHGYWIFLFVCTAGATPLCGWSCISLNIKELKIVLILLTAKQKRVNSHSFFDILNVFPVSGESGIQARSPCTAKAESIRRASE